jgi:uncharacterized membrane protein
VTRRVTGAILWANLHLLFWLSLVPFTTAWMGENHFAAFPTAVYGGVLFCAGAAYYVLQWAIVRSQGPQSELAAVLGRDWKGKVSPVLYLVAIAAAFVHPTLAGAIYAVVVLLWLVPDRRIEQHYADMARDERPAA